MFNYVREDGPLFTEEHRHLDGANVACIWTNADNSRRGRRVVGQAQLGVPRGGGDKWSKARAQYQLSQWFGIIPDFVLTFDALYASSAGEREFAALVDHELHHCAQAEDEFGMPRFNQSTGEPVWTMKGHDVEEFVSVVRRFGIEAAGQQAVEMVLAAAKEPEIGSVKLSEACGTCMRLVA